MTNNLENNAIPNPLAGRGKLQLGFAAPLAVLLEDGFDYKAFRKAVKADDRLSDKQKNHTLAMFDPKARMMLPGENPIPGFTAHMEAGASREMRLPTDKQGWDRNSKRPLPDDHPISEMWKDVWQQTVVHYAAEATEYEQIMTAKGQPMLDDPNGYPAKAPPIYLMPKMSFINAAAGLSEDGKSEAMVTAGFLEKLSPDQQRAILFHEAQHAFEPVLEGKAPMHAMVQHAITSLLTSNHAARHWERRADEHAAKMGHGDAMESAFMQMEEEQKTDYLHRATVLRHLDDCGFKLSFDKVQDFMEAAAEAKQKIESGQAPGMAAHLSHSFQSDSLVSDIPPQEFIGTIKDGIGALKGGVDAIGNKVRETANNIGENLLRGQVESVNNRISMGGQHDRAAQAGTLKLGAEAKQERGGFRGRIEEARERMHDARSSHPKTSDRIEHVKHVDKCKGCEDPSPFASHGDRVKAISKTGIQGIGASR